MRNIAHNTKRYQRLLITSVLKVGMMLSLTKTTAIICGKPKNTTTAAIANMIPAIGSKYENLLFLFTLLSFWLLKIITSQSL
jgi:hypothetical protein